MERIKKIISADSDAVKRSGEKWNSVAKPLHSLGLLEENIMKIAGIFGSENFTLDKRCAVVMCADHGVVSEGVTQTDRSVTAVVAKAVAKGTSNINLMANSCNADVFGVDIGIVSDMECENLIDRKIAYGTGNISKGAAMTYEEAEKSIRIGMDMVGELKEKGYKIIVTGEMGIGNTTACAAVSSVLTGLPPEQVTGRGAGLDDKGLERKIASVRKSIEINSPDKNDPVDILAKIGGFDIGGMTGLFLGGAYYHIPVVIDGVISAAAAVLAARLSPKSVDYMLCSHVSGEIPGKKLLEILGLKPVINAGLRLGEGTGGVLLLPLLDAAMAVYDSSHLFDNLQIKKYKEL